MQAFTYSTISKKGQITLPVRIRKHLKVTYGDKVSLVIDPTGEVKVTFAKYPDIQSLRGVAGSLKQKLTFKEMKKIAYEDRF